MLVAPPPSIRPIFEVVSSSILPICIFDMASDATTIAFIPFSGSIPACAFLPLNVHLIFSIAGAL